MHRVVPLKVHYYGTPVVLVSSTNPDGTTNLAPMSSAWWLGQNAMLGLGARSRTTQNLLRTREAVLNLASADLVDHVDRLAMLTGEPELTPHKRETGYRYEPRKFEAAGLTPEPSDLVAPHRVAECPIQLECRVSGHYPIANDSVTAQAIHVEVRPRARLRLRPAGRHRLRRPAGVGPADHEVLRLLRRGPAADPVAAGLGLADARSSRGAGQRVTRRQNENRF